MFIKIESSDQIGYCNRRALLIRQSSLWRSEHKIITKLLSAFYLVATSFVNFFHHLIGQSGAGCRFDLSEFPIPSQCITGFNRSYLYYLQNAPGWL